MSHQARRRVASALREHARRQVSTGARMPHYGIVRAKDPMQIELVDRRTMLQEADFFVTQWVRRYDYDHGLGIGDTVLVLHMPNDDFLVADVVSSAKIEAGLDEDHRTNVSHPSRNGTIVAEVPYLNEAGATVGVVAVYGSIHDDPGGVDLPVT